MGFCAILGFGGLGVGGFRGLDLHVVGFRQTLNTSVILFLNLSGAFGRDPKSRRCKGFYVLGVLGNTKSAALGFRPLNPKPSILRIE